ncbi:MAG: AraC family transcriptional regulator [Kiritimatiellae bacterium]|nr:AraC family transcriptional regulator [Kiritimatiellia bacterium]
MDCIKKRAGAGRPRRAAADKRFLAVPIVGSIGKMIMDPVWARNMHRSGSNELMHVIRGNVSVRMGRRRLEAGPDDTLLIPAGTLHRDEFDLSVGLEVFYVFFDWPPSKDYFRIVPAGEAPRFCASIAAEIGKLCDRMQVGLDAGTETDRLLINSYTHNILLLVLREAVRPETNRPPSAGRHHGEVLLLKARQYIDLHYAEPLSLDKIAEGLQISSFYLSHLFSRGSGCSFVEYITRVRLRKAQELLAESLRNVSEVAHAVGYNDSNYFSKVFHRYFGVSPQDARCAPAGGKRADAIP